jgi:hypothetical protein
VKRPSVCHPAELIRNDAACWPVQCGTSVYQQVKYQRYQTHPRASVIQILYATPVNPGCAAYDAALTLATVLPTRLQLCQCSNLPCLSVATSFNSHALNTEWLDDTRAECGQCLLCRLIKAGVIDKQLEPSLSRTAAWAELVGYATNITLNLLQLQMTNRSITMLHSVLARSEPDEWVCFLPACMCRLESATCSIKRLGNAVFPAELSIPTVHCKLSNAAGVSTS